LALAQTPPTAQTPSPQTAQPPQTPSTTQTPNPASAPPPPLPPDEYKNLSEISVELYYWMQTSHPQMRPGKANIDGDSPTLGSGINLLGPSKGAEGILVSAPAGRANHLEFEYFQEKQSGNEIAPINLILFGQGFLQGDLLASTTKIQHARVSWSYLTYPDPPGIHKFRFRTLYGVEYTSMTARFDAPADLNAAPIEASRSIIFPTFGASVEYHFSKRALIEAKAEGFAWPHKAVQGDADARIALKLFKQLDLVLGGRYFYFKTNPEKDYYLKSSMFGPYGGLRWTFK
jgi:hypothetical protein